MVRAAGLLSGVYASGLISNSSREALLEVPALGAEIGRALGRDVPTTETLLLTVLVDDSYSVEPYQLAIRGGYALVLEDIGGAGGARCLVHARSLNVQTLFPYTPLRDTPQLTVDVFRPVSGGTPLYRESLITLGTVMSKAQELEAAGCSVRSFTLIVTDGEDNRSAPIEAEHVRCVVMDMLGYSTNHIVAGMGIGDQATFRRVFAAMGIPAQWILTPGGSPDDIRATFGSVAASLRLAASSKAEFLQLEAGPASSS